MWSISPTIIVRKSTIIDRKCKYQPRYRPHRNALFCGSFPYCKAAAVEVFQGFLGLRPYLHPSPY